MRELTNVRKGINCVYYGLFLIVGSILILFLGAFLLVASPAIGLIVMAFAPFMVLSGTILELVGRVLCLSVPRKVQATGVIGTAVTCDIAVVSISALGWITDLPAIVGSLSNLLSLTAAILFLIFLKKLAAFIEDQASERRAVNLLKLGVATFAVTIIGALFPPLLIVAILLVIIGFVMYILLLTSLKESLKAASTVSASPKLPPLSQISAIKPLLEDPPSHLEKQSDLPIASSEEQSVKRFTIRGMNKATGESEEFDIEADSEHAAQECAEVELNLTLVEIVPDIKPSILNEHVAPPPQTNRNESGTDAVEDQAKSHTTMATLNLLVGLGAFLFAGRHLVFAVPGVLTYIINRPAEFALTTLQSPLVVMLTTMTAWGLLQFAVSIALLFGRSERVRFASLLAKLFLVTSAAAVPFLVLQTVRLTTHHGGLMWTSYLGSRLSSWGFLCGLTLVALWSIQLVIYARRRDYRSSRTTWGIVGITTCGLLSLAIIYYVPAELRLMAAARKATAIREATAAIEAVGGRVERRGRRLRGIGVGVSINLANTNATDKELSLIQEFASVIELILDDTQISNIGLKKLKDVPGLKALSIRGTDISDDGLAILTTLEELEYLNLTSTRVTPAGLREFRISRPDCQIRCQNANLLASIRKLGGRITQTAWRPRSYSTYAVRRTRMGPSVGSVDFSQSRVTDDDLLQLNALDTIGRLDLSHTQIGDAGLKHLSGLTSLGNLLLSETQVSDAGLVHLKELKNLTLLTLDGTNATERGVKDLQAVLPRCGIRLETPRHQPVSRPKVKRRPLVAKQIPTAPASLIAARSNHAADPESAAAATRLLEALHTYSRQLAAVSSPHAAEIRAEFLSVLSKNVSKHSISESGWKLTRTVDCPQARSAHYNPRDGHLYVARFNSKRDGLYRVEADGSLTMIAAAKLPIALAIDPRDGDIFISEEASSQVLRVPFGSKERSVWVSGFHAGDDDPTGIAIASMDYEGPAIAPGDALVVDNGWGGPKEIWKFSPDMAEDESAVHHDNGTLKQPVDITIGKNAIFMIDLNVKRSHIYSVHDGGTLKELPTSQPIALPIGISTAPITGDLLVLDAALKRLVRVNPTTGHTSEVFTAMYGFGANLAGGLSLAGVDTSPDGRQIYITNTTAGAIFTFTREGTAKSPLDARLEFENPESSVLPMFKAHTAEVGHLTFSKDGTRLLSTSCDHTVCVWDTTTQEAVKSLVGHTSCVQSACFSPHEDLIASSGMDKSVRIWDAADGSLLQTLQGHTQWSWDVEFSPDGKTLASAGADGTIRLWNPKTGQHFKTLTGHPGVLFDISFSPDGSSLVSAGADRSVRLWDLDVEKPIRTFRGHTDKVESVAFLPDGKRIVTGSWDKSVRLWDVKTGREVKRFDGHSDIVRNVAVSRDGTKIASGSTDKTCRIWEVESGRAIAVFRTERQCASTVVFHPDGKHVAFASGVYPLDSGGRRWKRVEDYRIRLWEYVEGTETIEGRGVRELSER